MDSSDPDSREPLAAFVEAACVPIDGSWHASGTLARADAILAAHPEVASASIHAAAILGDEAGVRRFLALDAANATAKGGPRGWDALTHLCFSNYLRLDKARSPGFVRAAEALLDAGADANTGFYAQDHDPPELESAIYGAAGVAHHAALTRLLLERGADPNDGETPYHTPESLDDEALFVLVESERLTEDGLTTMLRRKLDWHHLEGVAWLLEHRADPNRLGRSGGRALHHALGRTSSLRTFELLLDHGADPVLPSMDGKTAFTLAARMGRADVLALFERRAFAVVVTGDEVFLAACARGDEAEARAMVAGDPGLVGRLQAEDAALLAEFAGAGNTDGVRLLLDLGFAIGSTTSRGGAGDDSALHVAVWRERPATVKLLLERGAALEATNRHGETPLALAARAQVEQSDWTPHGSVEILAALLAAGADVAAVKRFPTGAAAADELLRRHGKSG